MSISVERMLDAIIQDGAPFVSKKHGARILLRKARRNEKAVIVMEWKTATYKSIVEFENKEVAREWIIAIQSLSPPE